MKDVTEICAAGQNRCSAFSYRCHGCGECCHHFTIQVNPYEVLRLARRLGITTDDFARRYLVDGPWLRRKDEGCVLLRGRECGVHADRPLVCRLYPLVRNLAADGTETFACLEPVPGSAAVYGRGETIAAYLTQQKAGEFLAMADRYLALYRRLATTLDQGGPELQAPPSTDVDATRLLDADYMVAWFSRTRQAAFPTNTDAIADRHIEAVEGWLNAHFPTVPKP